MLGPIATNDTWAKNDDVDRCLDLHRFSALLTGLEADWPVLNVTDTCDLDVSARLTFCGKCWDDDVKGGRQPYIRRKWARWQCVSCSEHQSWLSARRPSTDRGSGLNGWAQVWQTNDSWAEKSFLRYEPTYKASEIVFGPDAFCEPESSWATFETEIEALNTARDYTGKSVLGLVCKSTYSGLRLKSMDSLCQRDLARVSDFNLMGYRGSQPGWIADRIAALSLAIEVSRMIAGAAPCFSGLRRLIRSSEEGHRLTGHLQELNIRDNFRFSDPERAL